MVILNQLKSKVLLLLLLKIFILVNVKSQVEIKLDYKTQKLTVTDIKKFKVGENIQFCINEYDITVDDQYIILYQAEEYRNETGIAKFSEPKIEQSGAERSSSSYCYLPIQIQDKDYSVLTLKRFRKGETNPVEERVYRYRNRCSIKFDVSSGIFVTRQNVVQYSLETIKDTPTFKKIIKEDLGNHKVGIGLLAHLHSRWPSWINLGASVGFELDGNTKLSYLTGVSLFLGYDRKFVLTGGIGFSKHQKLSAIYSEGESISSEVNELPLVEKWEGNLFWAVTYNF